MTTPTEQTTKEHQGLMPAKVVLALTEIAAILDNRDTKTSSGLPVTVLEMIDVQVAAARELREMVAEYATLRPDKFVVDREAFIAVMASLAAAISLLENGGRKAAPSDKMFGIMLDDYKRALNTGREAFHRAG